MVELIKRTGTGQDRYINTSIIIVDATTETITTNQILTAVDVV